MKSFTVLTVVLLLTDNSFSIISLRNVRRSPIRYRPARARPVSSDRDTTEDDRSQSSYHPPRLRRRPPFHERMLNRITGLIPTLPSFNIIKRSGGFRRPPPPGRRRETGDLRRVTTVNHRIGENKDTSAQTLHDEDHFEKQINQFRSGLMVNDPRGNFYKSSTLHETRNDDFRDNNFEIDIRKNLIHREEQERRRRGPRRSPDPGPNISSYPGPPYPGPHPRNPRLPLDKTIIFP